VDGGQGLGLQPHVGVGTSPAGQAGHQQRRDAVADAGAGEVGGHQRRSGQMLGGG
jgi:hypothetical protein